MARNKFAERYDVARKPHEYQVGDAGVYRLRLSSSMDNNISGKCLLRWSKPEVIAKVHCVRKFVVQL